MRDTTETTPLPLFRSEEKKYSANRVAEHFQMVRSYFVSPEQHGTSWGKLAPESPHYIFNCCDLRYVYAVAVTSSLLALRAEAEGEPTRPVVLVRCPFYGGGAIFGGPGALPTTIQGYPILGYRAEPPELAIERPQPEFVWSKALYRARKAAQEFSEETHADY